MRKQVCLLFLFVSLPSLLTAQETFRPELVLQTGHARPINSLAISPDGKWLVSGSQDFTAKIWEISSGKLLRTLMGHNGKINAVAISPDGHWIATGAEDRTVRLWSVIAGGQEHVLSGHTLSVKSVAFRTDSQHLFSGAQDAIIEWDCASGQKLRSLPIDEKDRKGRIQISPDGKYFLVGAANTTSGDLYRPWTITEISSGHKTGDSKVEKSSPYGTVAFSPDGKYLAIRSSQFKDKQNVHSIKIIDTNSGNDVTTLQVPGGQDPNGLGALAFSPDGKTIAIQDFGNLQGTVRVWDIASKKQINQLSTGSLFASAFSLNPDQFSINPFSFSPDGKLLALGGTSRIEIWDASTGKEFQSLKTSIRQAATAEAMDPAFADAMKKSGLRESDLDSMSSEMSSVVETLTDPSGPLSQLAPIIGIFGGTNIYSGNHVNFSADGRWLFTTKGDQVDVWDISGGVHLPPRTGRTRILAPAVFSPDGRYFACMSDHENQNKTLTLRDPATLEVLKEFKDVNSAQQIAFRSDGKSLAVSDQNHITVLDLNSGEMLGSVSVEQNASYLTFAADGSIAAYQIGPTGANGLPFVIPSNAIRMPVSPKDAKNSKNPKMPDMTAMLSAMANAARATGPQQIKVVDTLTGADKFTIALEGQPAPAATNGPQTPFTGGLSVIQYPVVISPDGRMLAIRDWKQQKPVIKIVDAAGGDIIQTIDDSAVRGAISFNSDGKMLAAFMPDLQGNSVRIFEVRSGSEIKRIPITGIVTSLSFHPSGRFLITLAQDDREVVWDTKSGEQVATLVYLPVFQIRSEWLVVRPDGLFDGSPGGWSQIQWRFSPGLFDTAPVEAFFNEYYEPGLLNEIFSGKMPQAPKNISQLDRRQPAVKLTSSAAGATSDRSVSLQIQVTEAAADATHPRGSGARDLRLFRNGSLVKVWHDAISGTVNATVPIVAGENRFVAYAFSDSNIKSPDSSLVITGADSLKRTGVAYVVAVGVNQYANSNFNLKYAVSDAQDFGEALRQSQLKLKKYSDVQLISLTDENATKANVLSAIAKIGAIAQPEDAVFIYFAGHGTAQESRFYIVPHDLGYSGSRDALNDTGMKEILTHSISDLELQNAFEKIDASEILLIIDACNSGQALESEEKRRGLMNSKGLAQLAYEKGMYVLAAAQGYQAALEAEKLGHGYLTYALVEEGLKTDAADRSPHDGQVWVREWLDYSTERVPEMQSTKIQEARLLKHDVAFVEGEKETTESQAPGLQRPRVFYRREAPAEPLIITQQ